VLIFRIILKILKQEEDCHFAMDVNRRREVFMKGQRATSSYVRIGHSDEHKRSMKSKITSGHRNSGSVINCTVVDFVLMYSQVELIDDVV
jgi:hypothetical protein